ncbi:MAG: universal stress protein [Xanthomonadales bacterium]|nr:universal stress protein [Xanthomonadales bacterium]
MSLVFLVGVDCSNCSNRALEYAAERAAGKDSKLVIAHIIEWSPFTFSTPQENEERHKRREEELARAHEEIIDPLVSQFREKGIDVEGVVRHGHASETLLRIAREVEASNIVVGRKGTSRFKAQLFGSVASAMVQIADRPVTVVP